MDIKKADAGIIERILTNRTPGPEGVRDKFAVLALLLESEGELSHAF